MGSSFSITDDRQSSSPSPSASPSSSLPYETDDDSTPSSTTSYTKIPDFGLSPSEVSHLHSTTSISSLFCYRLYRLLRVGFSYPTASPLLIFLVLLNFALQFLAGYVAQSIFYYTGTGKGASDPGMSGCLKNSNCSSGTYQFYLSEFAWSFVLLVLCVCAFSVTGDLINTQLRDRINSSLQHRLLNGHLLYRLQISNKIDNFDQRITADLQEFLSGISCAIWGNTSDYLAYPVVFCFSRVMFAYNNVLNPPSFDPLSSGSSLAVVGISFLMMFLSLLAYVIPMNKISYLFFLSQRFEGDFRTFHSSAIINCEQISLYGGERRERVRGNEKYDRIYAVQMKYYRWQAALMCLRLFSTVAQPSIGYLLLAIVGSPNTAFASAFLKQMGDVLEYLLYFPAIIARVAFAAGAAHRVGQLMEAIDQLEAMGMKGGEGHGSGRGQNHNVSREQGVEMKPLPSPSPSSTHSLTLPSYAPTSPSSSPSSSPSPSSIDYIELINVTAGPPVAPSFKTPDVSLLSLITFKGDRNAIGVPISGNVKGKEEPVGLMKPLFQNLSLRLNRGDNMIIMAPSGCGKSSLLRVIAGLWPVTSGQIVRPPSIGKGGLFFLPQRAYVFPGTLAQQILYPIQCSPSHKLSMDEERMIRSYCEVLDLCHLIDDFGFYQTIDFPTVLSSSERQRLSFIRLYYHKPVFCLADESTSTLDLHSEAMALSMCKTLNITLISVAHRTSVILFHQKLLNFDKVSRTWEFLDVVQSNIYDEIVEEEKEMGKEREKQRKDKEEMKKRMETNNVDGSHNKKENSQTATSSSSPSTKTSSSAPSSHGLNLLFFRRLLSFFALICPSPSSPSSLLLFLIIISMSLYGGSQILVFTYLKSDTIINNIINGNNGTAILAAVYYLAVNVLTSILQAISAYSGVLIAVLLQRKITMTLHSLYMRNNVLYTMNAIEKIEGIDGRIVSDGTQLKESLAWMLGNPFAYLNYRFGIFPLAISFIIMLCFSFTMAVTLTLFFLGSLMVALLIQVLSGRVTSTALSVRQESEGTLRSHLGRVKNSVESITFFEGISVERERGNVLLADTIKARYRYFTIAALTVFPTCGAYYFLSNGQYVMASIIQEYTSSHLNPTDIFNTIAFLTLLGKIGMLIIQSTGGLSFLSSATHRVAEVKEMAEMHQERNVNVLKKHRESDGEGVRVEQVDVMQPSKGSSHNNGESDNDNSPSSPLCLVRNLNFHLNPSNRNDNIVIYSSAAGGKSAIARVISGLWSCAPGRISRPLHRGQNNIFFLPQSNYIPDGTLRQQLIYPHSPSECHATDEELEGYLLSVGLDYLLDRFGPTLDREGVDWSQVLSGGEAQRIGIIRLLYHSPAVAIVDECSSALDLSLERKCMEEMMVSKGIRLISMATRLTQLHYHSRVINLDGQGGWTEGSTKDHGNGGDGHGHHHFDSKEQESESKSPDSDVESVRKDFSNVNFQPLSYVAKTRIPHSSVVGYGPYEEDNNIGLARRLTLRQRGISMSTTIGLPHVNINIINNDNVDIPPTDPNSPVNNPIHRWSVRPSATSNPPAEGGNGNGETGNWRATGRVFTPAEQKLQ